MRVDALMRRVQGAGGFATVLRHGDDTAGALIVVIRDRAGNQVALSRTMEPKGYGWTESAREGPEESGVIAEYLARQQRYDTDLWAVELDIADAERFVAESNGDD